MIKRTSECEEVVPFRYSEACLKNQETQEIWNEKYDFIEDDDDLLQDIEDWQYGKVSIKKICEKFNILEEVLYEYLDYKKIFPIKRTIEENDATCPFFKKMVKDKNGLGGIIKCENREIRIEDVNKFYNMKCAGRLLSCRVYIDKTNTCKIGGTTNGKKKKVETNI